MFWTAKRVDYCRDFNKKFGICLYEHNRFTFFCHYLPFLCFSPCSRGKKICVCCSERTPRFYSVEFYGTDLYNFKSSYFSIHAKYSSITTKKHVTKIRIKKNYSITLIFSEHCTVALLCASISEAKKKTL